MARHAVLLVLGGVLRGQWLLGNFGFYIAHGSQLR